MYEKKIWSQNYKKKTKKTLDHKIMKKQKKKEENNISFGSLKTNSELETTPKLRTVICF